MALIFRKIKKTLRRRGSGDHRKEKKEEEMHKKHIDQAGDKVKETQHLGGHGQGCREEKKKRKEKEEEKESYNSSSGSDDSD